MLGRRGRPPKTADVEAYDPVEPINVMDELIKDNPLNVLISEIRILLSRYQNSVTTNVIERNGKVTEIEITARILP